MFKVVFLKSNDRIAVENSCLQIRDSESALCPGETAGDQEPGNERAKIGGRVKVAGAKGRFGAIENKIPFASRTIGPNWRATVVEMTDKTPLVRAVVFQARPAPNGGRTNPEKLPLKFDAPNSLKLSPAARSPARLVTTRVPP